MDKSINEEAVTKINDILKEIKSNVLRVFENLYKEPFSKINYATNVEYEEKDITEFLLSLHIEPELIYGSFLIELLYVNGTIKLYYEDNFTHVENNDYQLHFDCYNLLNEISTNLKLIQ